MSRYIDAEKAIAHFNLMYDEQEGKDDPYNVGVMGAINYIKHRASSIDIVFCKECKYFIDNLTEDATDEMYDACRWDWKRRIPNPDDYCSYGEREGE